MHSTSALSEAQPEGVRVWHYDGRTGVRHSPVLVVEGEYFRLEGEDLRSERHAFADLAPLGHGDRWTFSLKGRSGWRIGFDQPPPPMVAALLPGGVRYGGLIDRFGLWRSAAVFTVAATIGVIGFLQVPSLVAKVVPMSVERQLGEVMIGDFGNRFCASSEGDAALARLAERLAPDLPDANVRVANLPVVNAVTLPGGQIILFSGLIERAHSPDEVAGVIGHELGHVEHRDVIESLLRQLGLSVLLGGLDGHVSGYTNALLSTAYSRDAEGRADAFAIDAMVRNHISPEPTAQFFSRLSKAEPTDRSTARIISYMSSHPMAADRARRFDDATHNHGPYRPALDADDWNAIRTICKGKPVDTRFHFNF